MILDYNQIPKIEKIEAIEFPNSERIRKISNHI